MEVRDTRPFWARAAAPSAAAGFLLSLAVVGWIVGHAGAYAFVEPAHGNARLGSVHSYMTPLTASAFGVALVALLAFAAARRAPRARSGFWSRAPAPAALVAFALVPTCAYVLVELAEHVSVGELPAAPTLLVGLIFQLPLGPLAALTARRLLRTVERLVARRRRRRLRWLSGGSSDWLPRAAEVFRFRPLAGAIAGRAPPPGH